MRILITGATGYIGKRIIPVLLEDGHEIIACVRDRSRFETEYDSSAIEIVEADLVEQENWEGFPMDFDIAFYLIHSMSAAIGDFEDMEEQAAKNFNTWLDQSSAKQVIYLSGLVNAEKLSKHLESRLNVERVLRQGKVPLTTLRAGIIVGSGSASFEIIRDLAEKLPVMVAPKWVNTKCQPIGIRNIIQCLTGVIDHPECIGETFDVGGPDVLTYREMLYGYARVRKLKRFIFTVPVMTPRLSSYWLYFVTSTTYELAVNLVNSMKVDAVVRENRLLPLLDIEPIPYEKAVEMAFDKIEQQQVVSSWKDSYISSTNVNTHIDYIKVPEYGCFKDKKKIEIVNNTEETVLENIWSIGGNRGWYYGSWLWKTRGYLDKLAGGIGLRRGRTHPNQIHPGDALDFWRVLVASREAKRLLLYAEMKLPGDAWLEFKITNENGKSYLNQTATFRPSGVLGRMYWFAVLPLHIFVFNGMIRKLEKYKKPQDAVVV